MTHLVRFINIYRKAHLHQLDKTEWWRMWTWWPKWKAYLTTQMFKFPINFYSNVLFIVYRQLFYQLTIANACAIINSSRQLDDLQSMSPCCCSSWSKIQALPLTRIRTHHTPLNVTNCNLSVITCNVYATEDAPVVVQTTTPSPAVKCSVRAT